MKSKLSLIRSTYLVADALKNEYWCAIIRTWETKAGRLTLFFGGANPPDERKGGVANGYIY